MTEAVVLPRADASRAKAVEQIALTLQSTGLRRVAIASPDTDVATAALVEAVAEVAARSGRRTLVIDLARPDVAPHWLPDGSAASPAPDPKGRGFDVLSAPPGPAARAAWNNPERTAKALDGLLERYELVLVHGAGLIEDGCDNVNMVAAGAATQGIILVCPTSLVTVTNVERAMELVAAAGGKVVGTVLDDRVNPLLGADMARVAARLPGGQWLARRLARSELLRTPIYR